MQYVSCALGMITNVTSIKTLVEVYELDEPVTFDAGSGTLESFITSAEVSNKVFLILEQGPNGLDTRAISDYNFFENLGSFSVGWDRSQEVIKNF